MTTYSCSRACNEKLQFGQRTCHKCGTELWEFWRRLEREVESEKLAERMARGGPSRYHSGTSGNGGYYGT